MQVSDQRSYVKYTFLKVDPAWRRRSAEERAADKREFIAACREFGADHYLRAYSLVGTRGDCDLMVRALARTLDPIHELHVLLNQSGRMRVMREHIEVARRFPGIETNTAYSFGLDDQEFVVAFDADDPAEFLDLV